MIPKLEGLGKGVLLASPRRDRERLSCVAVGMWQQEAAGPQREGQGWDGAWKGEWVATAKDLWAAGFGSHREEEEEEKEEEEENLGAQGPQNWDSSSQNHGKSGRGFAKTLRQHRPENTKLSGKNYFEKIDFGAKNTNPAEFSSVRMDRIVDPWILLDVHKPKATPRPHSRAFYGKICNFSLKTGMGFMGCF